jgi:hypothetical protein
MNKEKKMAIDGYWGLCPICKKTDGYLNIGRNHWFMCLEHRTRWCIGSNLFSSWRDETEAEQRRECEKIAFDTFKDVKPFYPEIEGVERGNNDEGKDKGHAVPTKKSDRPRPAQVVMAKRHRPKK